MAYDKGKAKEKAIENENKAKELLKSVVDNYQENPELLAETFAFSKNFYQYSLKNTQLIFAQNRGATYCQNFQTWKQQGYPVQAGEHGLKIWVPVQTTLLDVSGNGGENPQYIQLSAATKEQKKLYEEGKIPSIKRTNFRIGTTFDIAQTSFPPEKYPELFSMGYPSETHANICKGIEEFSMNKLGCPVIRKDLKSISLKGCYYPQKNIININEKLEDDKRLSTTCHELGHALIHHNGSGNKSTSQKEIEADALSIMLEANYGLEINASRTKHFADHYQAYMEQELQRSEKEKTECDVDSCIDQIFTNVYTVYRLNIDDIENAVGKYINHDKTALLEQKKGDLNKPKEKNSEVKKALMQRQLQSQKIRKNEKGIEL